MMNISRLIRYIQEQRLEHNIVADLIRIKAKGRMKVPLFLNGTKSLHDTNSQKNLRFQLKKIVSSYTEYVDSQLSIYWREESINKMNEPPGDVECYCDGEENHTRDSQQIK